MKRRSSCSPEESIPRHHPSSAETRNVFPSAYQNEAAALPPDCPRRDSHQSRQSRIPRAITRQRLIIRNEVENNDIEPRPNTRRMQGYRDEFRRTQNDTARQTGVRRGGGYQQQNVSPPPSRVRRYPTYQDEFRRSHNVSPPPSGVRRYPTYQDEFRRSHDTAPPPSGVRRCPTYENGFLRSHETTTRPTGVSRGVDYHDEFQSTQYTALPPSGVRRCPTYRDEFRRSQSDISFTRRPRPPDRDLMQPGDWATPEVHQSASQVCVSVEGSGRRPGGMRNEFQMSQSEISISARRRSNPGRDLMQPGNWAAPAAQRSAPQLPNQECENLNNTILNNQQQSMVMRQVRNIVRQTRERIRQTIHDNVNFIDSKPFF